MLTMADKGKPSNRAGNARAGQARAGGGPSDRPTTPLPPRRNPEPVSENALPPPQGNSFEVAAQVVRDNAEQQRRRGGALIGSMGLNTATPNEFPAGGSLNSEDVVGRETVAVVTPRSSVADEVAALLRKLRGFQVAIDTWLSELRAGIPNDPTTHPQYLSIIEFLENLTKGISEVADGIEEAISAGEENAPEPILLGKAALVARAVSETAQKWLDEQGTKVIDVPVKLTVFGSALITLSHFGISGDAITGAIAGFVLGTAVKK